MKEGDAIPWWEGMARLAELLFQPLVGVLIRGTDAAPPDPDCGGMR